MLEFTAPIAEWAGSGTVQLAQNDVEYAWNSGNVTAAGGSDTTSFGYGPAGTPILNYNNLTLGSATAFTVQFQTPIQSGDQVILELSSDGVRWTPISIGNAGTVSGLTFQNTAVYGAAVKISSATQAIVEFGNAGRVPNGGAYGATASAWSGATTFKWRVRKSSGGSAVGFGIVSPGVSSGLVSASGLPGNTTGNAIASGYVGEVKTITDTTVTISTAGAWYGNTNAALTLTSGVWLLCVRGNILGATGLTTGNAGIATNGSNDSTGLVINNESYIGTNSGRYTDTVCTPTVVVVPANTSQNYYAKGITIGAATTSLKVNGTAIRIA